MRQLSAIAAALAAAPLCSAQVPLVSSRAAPAAKAVGSVTATSPGTGSFLMTTDDCAAPHANLGVGTQLGIPFDTSVQTTGSTGQSNSACLFFGLTGIANDGWGDWTASQDGLVTFGTCGSTVDTKLAVYPLSVCPADDTELGCNDDACGGNGLQSAVSWAATQGTTYTLQLGTFPGATQGAGTFDVVEAGPLPCGEKDDGSTENSLGWTNGGEIGWMTVWTTGPGTCLGYWDTVETAYGTLMFPGSVTNGASSQVAVYRDATPGDDTPTPSDLTLYTLVTTTVVNGDTDILNTVHLGTVVYDIVESDVWTLASAEHAAGEFPAPLDQSPPTQVGSAWFVGSTSMGGFGGVLDATDLANNDVPPMNLQTGAGLTANYLLRTASLVDIFGPGEPVCFGDGIGAPCGCGNESDWFSGGCRNSVSGTRGAFASASGTASQDQSSEPLTFQVTNVRTQPGLFFQAANLIGGGAGATFGDGLRCCGGGLVRVETIDPPPGPEPVTVTTTASFVPAPPGTELCYQYWYRDPGGPCGSNFNLSSAVTVPWIP